MSSENSREGWAKQPWKGTTVSLACFIVTLLVTPLIGAVSLSSADVLGGISPAADIFWDLRLPRVLLAAVVGCALAVSGAVFQALLRNDLATPFTLGIASGASLGAVIAIYMGLEGVLFLNYKGFVFEVSTLPAAAFAGATLVLILVLGMVRIRGPGMDSVTLLLAGVTVSFFSSAMILLIQYLSDHTETYRMIRWMMGGLDTVGMAPFLQTFPVVLVGVIGIWLQAPSLNQLLTGELLAASRGVAVRRVRLSVMGIAAMITAAALAFTGPIGFIGLMVPHAMRRVVGSDHKWLIPASALGGGTLLPVCDAIARTVIAPTEIPVGVLTALLGSPFFLFILLRRR